MALMKIVYSKLPSAVQFFFPPEKCHIVIKGTNSNMIKADSGVVAPHRNEVAEHHWQYIKDVYGKGDYPHYFTGIKGGDDAIYEAPSEVKAEERLLNTAPARDAETLVSSDKKVTKFNKNDDL